jgi:hypothetical protein
MHDRAMELAGINPIDHVTPMRTSAPPPASDLIAAAAQALAHRTCTGFDPAACALDAYDQSIAATAAAQDYRVLAAAIQAVARSASNVRSRSAIRAID